MEVNSKIVDQLADSELFFGLARKDVADILGNAKATSRLFKKGEMVLSPDYFEHCLAYVLRGRLIIKLGDNGLALRELEAGTFFAVATLFNDAKKYISNIYALRDSDVIFIAQDVVEDCIRKYPQFSINYVRHLHKKIKFMHSEIMALGSSSAKNALISYLWNSSLDLGEEYRLEVSYSKLARSLNMSRSSLYRVLDELEEEQIISRNGRLVTLNKKFDLSE